jgi:hypothetical protein
LNDVKTVTTAKMCWEKRRPEIVHVFEREVYGRVPMNAPKLKLGGSLDNERGEWQWSNHYEEVGGTRRPLRISLCDRGHRPDSQDASQCERSGAGEDGLRLEPRVFSVSGPALSGDECVAPGTHMAVAGSRQRLGYAIYVPHKCAGGQGRRINAGRDRLVNKGQPRKLDDWGPLRAWPWGASRALDYLETDTSVDAKHFDLEGSSRYGKASSVAMAYDPRFAIAFII